MALLDVRVSREERPLAEPQRRSCPGLANPRCPSGFKAVGYVEVVNYQEIDSWGTTEISPQGVVVVTHHTIVEGGNVVCDHDKGLYCEPAKEDVSDESNNFRLIEPAELAPIQAAQSKTEDSGVGNGPIMSVRIFLEAQGFGSFKGQGFDTAKGDSTAWVLAAQPLSLLATPASGWRFSHWTLNGNFAGDKPSISLTAKIGMKIKAFFQTC